MQCFKKHKTQTVSVQLVSQPDLQLERLSNNKILMCNTLRDQEDVEREKKANMRGRLKIRDCSGC